MAVVDLDRDHGPQRKGQHDRGLAAVLVVAGVAFVSAVWMGRPTAVPLAQPSRAAADADPSIMFVPRANGVRVLQLPAAYLGADLGAMPDRLANEAAPWTMRAVVTIRGVPGVASIEGPAMIAWTENGIAYVLASPTRTTAELIAIADTLQ